MMSRIERAIDQREKRKENECLVAHFHQQNGVCLHSKENTQFLWLCQLQRTSDRRWIKKGFRCCCWLTKQCDALKVESGHSLLNIGRRRHDELLESLDDSRLLSPKMYFAAILQFPSFKCNYSAYCVNQKHFDTDSIFKQRVWSSANDF